MSIVVNPKVDKVEISAYSFFAPAHYMNTTCGPNGVDGCTILNVQVCSSVKQKVELKVNGTTKTTIMTQRNETVNLELGISLENTDGFTVLTTNMDDVGADCYVSFRYIRRNLWEEFSRNFDRELEEKLTSSTS